MPGQSGQHERPPKAPAVFPFPVPFRPAGPGSWNSGRDRFVSKRDSAKATVLTGEGARRTGGSAHHEETVPRGHRRHRASPGAAKVTARARPGDGTVTGVRPGAEVSCPHLPAAPETVRPSLLQDSAARGADHCAFRRHSITKRPAVHCGGRQNAWIMSESAFFWDRGLP